MPVDFYRPYSKKKKSGGTREIANPQPEIKQVQSRIYQRLLRPHVFSDISFGSVPERCHLDAAARHKSPKLLRSLDVAECFSSVSSFLFPRFQGGHPDL